MDMLTGVMLGFVAWIVVRFVLTGFYTVGPNERAQRIVERESSLTLVRMRAPGMLAELLAAESGAGQPPLVEV